MLHNTYLLIDAVICFGLLAYWPSLGSCR